MPHQWQVEGVRAGGDVIRVETATWACGRVCAPAPVFAE